MGNQRGDGQPSRSVVKMREPAQEKERSDYLRSRKRITFHLNKTSHDSHVGILAVAFRSKQSKSTSKFVQKIPMEFFIKRTPCIEALTNYS